MCDTEPIYTEHIGQFRIDVFPDDCILSPRVEFDNLGTMVCWHSRYDLGDSNPWDTADEFHRWRRSRGTLCLPLYLNDHSGLSMSTKPFASPWDSGQVGWIFATQADLEKEYGPDDQEPRAKGRRVLTGEVAAYSMYLAGDVYYATVTQLTRCSQCKKVHGETVDSLGGLYGLDRAVDWGKETIAAAGDDGRQASYQYDAETPLTA